MGKLLIIEDDHRFIDIYEREFSGVCSLRMSDDGELGVYSAKDWQPDAILLDMQLRNGTDGFEVLKRLKEDEKTREIPVILVTILDGIERLAYRNGVSEFFMKLNTDLKQVVGTTKEYVNGFD